MKKQYTNEYAYDRNIKITFYENGVKTYFTIISEWEADGYLSAKEEDGWQKAYSHAQMQETMDKITSLEESLSRWKKHLEKIKNNLIGR